MGDGKTAAVHRKAKTTVRAMLREAATLADESAVKFHTKWWRESEGSSRVNAMLARAATEEGIPVLPDQLDSDPWLLNVGNGTIDLRTGKLRPHRREDLITCLAPVNSTRGAVSAMGASAGENLSRKRGGDPVRPSGSSGWRSPAMSRNRSCPSSTAAGANGKSTLLTVMLEMLGEDYAMMRPRGC